MGPPPLRGRQTTPSAPCTRSHTVGHALGRWLSLGRGWDGPESEQSGRGHSALIPTSPGGVDQRVLGPCRARISCFVSGPDWARDLRARVCACVCVWVCRWVMALHNELHRCGMAGRQTRGNYLGLGRAGGRGKCMTHAPRHSAAAHPTATDQKTSGAALQLRRSLLRPLFLLLVWRSPTCVCVCVSVFFRKAPVGVGHVFCLTPTDEDSHSATIVGLCFAIVCVCVCVPAVPLTERCPAANGHGFSVTVSSDLQDLSTQRLCLSRHTCVCVCVRVCVCAPLVDGSVQLGRSVGSPVHGALFLRLPDSCPSRQGLHIHNCQSRHFTTRRALTPCTTPYDICIYVYMYMKSICPYAGGMEYCSYG